MITIENSPTKPLKKKTGRPKKVVPTEPWFTPARQSYLLDQINSLNTMGDETLEKILTHIEKVYARMLKDFQNYDYIVINDLIQSFRRNARIIADSYASMKSRSFRGK